MKRKSLVLSLIAVAVLGAAGYGAYMFGMQRGIGRAETHANAGAVDGAAPDTSPQTIAQGEAATRKHIAAGLKAGDIDPATGKKILYYHDPMVPGNKFDKP
ncbi:MAG: efflux RND transporter periplasmic adaptor subunit, partial [Burkholderiaceae bacterium]